MFGEDDEAMYLARASGVFRLQGEWGGKSIVMPDPNSDETPILMT